MKKFLKCFGLITLLTLCIAVGFYLFGLLLNTVAVATYVSSPAELSLESICKVSFWGGAFLVFNLALPLSLYTYILSGDVEEKKVKEDKIS